MTETAKRFLLEKQAEINALKAAIKRARKELCSRSDQFSCGICSGIRKALRVRRVK